MPTRRNALVVGLAALAPFVANGALAQGDPPVNRRLRFTATLTNPGAQALRDQVAWIYMPMRETATQHLERLDVSMPHELLNDALGQSILKLTVADLPPLASKLVSIGAELAVHREPRRARVVDAPAWLAGVAPRRRP